MKSILLIMILTLPFTAYAQAGLGDSDEQKIKEKIQQWYQQIGFNGGQVSQKVFEATVRGYFYYGKQGKISGNGLMAIVNFEMTSSQKRLFIFTIGDSAKLIGAYGVAHGTGTSKIKSPMIPGFSNQSGTNLSSRGFIKTASSRHSSPTFGFPSINLIGLEPGVNSNIEARLIKIHPIKGFDLDGSPKMAGYSEGCLAIPYNKRDEITKLLVGGVLIYVSDGKSHTNYPFMGGSGSIKSEDLERVPNREPPVVENSLPDEKPIESDPFWQNKSPTIAEKTGVNFNYKSPLGISSLLGPDTVLAAMGTLQQDDPEKDSYSEDVSNKNSFTTKAPFHGSESYANCQLRANESWDKVVGDATSPAGNVSSRFSSSYVKLMNDSKQASLPDPVIAQAAKNMYASNKDCMGQAASMGHSDFTDNPNEAQKIRSEDGKIVCEKTGTESQDFSTCKEIIEVKNNSEVIEVNQNQQQRVALRASGVRQANSLGTDAQQTSILKAGELIAEERGHVSARARLQEDKANILNELQASLPSRDSLLSECRQNLRGKDLGERDLRNFLKLLDVQDKSIPQTGDPCIAVSKKMNVNLVQNIEGKKQTVKIIEKAGLKAIDLHGKAGVLLQQEGSMKNVMLRSGARDSFHNRGKGFKAQKIESTMGTVSARNHVVMTKVKRSVKRAKGINEIHGSGFSQSASRSSNQIRNRFDPMYFKNSNSKGIYNKKFYSKIKLALNGKISIASLSPNQKYEYNKFMARQNKRLKQNISKTDSQNRKENTINSSLLKLSIEEQKKTNKLSREIWFDKKLNIFQIISNRYKGKFTTVEKN